MKDFRVDTEVIDSVLDYIETDIKSQEDPEMVSHLVDIHSFLLSRKGDIIRKDEKPVSNDTLITYAYTITQSMNVVFGSWDAQTTFVDDGVIVYNDMVYIQVVLNEKGIECFLAFSKYIDAYIAAEVAITLRDIFGISLFISDSPYIIDEATNEFIWGDEDITNYQKKTIGYQIKPIVFFSSDGEVGNC